MCFLLNIGSLLGHFLFKLLLLDEQDALIILLLKEIHGNMATHIT